MEIYKGLSTTFGVAKNPLGRLQCAVSRARPHTEVPSQNPVLLEQHRFLSRLSGMQRGHVRHPSLSCFSVLLTLAYGNKMTGLLIANTNNVSLTVTLLTDQELFLVTKSS